jgi:putative DNA primase/helicase
MRQDYFECLPQFKLLFAGNHKSSLRSVDEAIRRRFKLIPFSVTIAKEKRDPDLDDKLKEEWTGILQWMLDRCMAWREQGLAPPEAVTTATASAHGLPNTANAPAKIVSPTSTPHGSNGPMPTA